MIYLQDDDFYGISKYNLLIFVQCVALWLVETQTFTFLTDWINHMQ